MHTLLIIVMAFVVPLAGITAFILIDKGFDALGRFFSRRRNRTLASNTAKSNSSASADDAGDKKIDLVQIDRPAAANVSPKPGCKKCAGCKLAATGGCRRKQIDSK